MLYPEIILKAMQLVRKLSTRFDVSGFIKKTELANYLEHVILLLPDNCDRQEFSSILEAFRG